MINDATYDPEEKLNQIEAKPKSKLSNMIIKKVHKK